MIESKYGFQKTLQSLLEYYGLNEAELSRKVKIPQPTVHRLVSGATPDPRISTLLPIAIFFNISVGQLVGHEPLNLEKKEHVIDIVLRKLPLIPWDEAHCWKELLRNYAPSNWAYWVSTKKEISPESFALNVESKSNIDFLSNNSILIVDSQYLPHDGDFVIVYRRSDRSTTIKKFTLDGNDKWLVPLNEKINAIIYSQDTLICGTVMQSNMSLIV